MAEYTLDDIFEPVFITLGESRFKLRERTKRLGVEFDKLNDRLIEIQEQIDREDDPDRTGESADAPIYLMLDMLDVLLEPVSENGTRTHAKTILKKAYENNDLGSDKIVGLLSFCQDQMEARLDPTQSRQRTDA